MFRNIVLATALTATAACQTTTSNYSTVDNTDTEVLGLTMMAQLMLTSGAAGLAAFPLLIAADLSATNEAMVRANSAATIEDTYRYVYKRDLNSVGPSGNTGTVFRDLKSATHHFRTVLDGHGVAFSEDFLITAVRTADTRGYTLYALVHRPARSIRVRTASGQIATLTERDEAFYRPYRTDVNGNLVDVVVDWAGIPRSNISTQKGQAILLTLAANSVMKNRRSDEYWSIEQRWLSGQYRQVVAERQREIERRMAQR